jgi:hypothetical protein
MKNAIEKVVCYTGHDGIKATFFVTDPLIVQVIGFMTSGDGVDHICLSDAGDYSYPFGISGGICPMLSPNCCIKIKKFLELPATDPHHEGVVISVFLLEEMEVVVAEYPRVLIIRSNSMIVLA